MEHEHSLLDEVEHIKKSTQALINKKKMLDHCYSIKGKPQTEFTKDEKIYKGIKYALHTIDKYFTVPLENTLLAELETVNEEKIEELKKLKTNLKRLVKIRKYILQLADSYKYRTTLTAKRIRAKRKTIEDPSKQKAIEEAVTMWKRTPRLSLDDIAEHIRKEGISEKSHAQIKRWIAQYNPKRKNKT